MVVRPSSWAKMHLADFIDRNTDAILEDAILFAKKQAPAGVTLSRKDLQDHLPQILKAIVADLRTPQSVKEQRKKSQGRAPQSTDPESAATYHGRTRAIAGFGVNQMVAEYRALRASVLRHWAADRALVTASVDSLVRFNEAIDQAVAESLAEFSDEVESWREIFLGALGHDLRGPLAAVVLSADILEPELKGTPHARHLERILAGGVRMSKLLDDLLEYSRSKLGDGMVIRATECDLAQALRDEMDLLRAALPGASINFTAGGDTSGLFDESRLREATHNLVTNAAKYGADGTAVSVVLLGHLDQVVIEVRNMGTEVTPAALERIFDPLARGTNTASRGEHASLGLGLFLVREIARAHGGTVEATSADGMTTFSLSLPRNK